MLENIFIIYKKEWPGSFLKESVCQDCADEINNSEDLDMIAVYDPATLCWEENEEICSECERLIDRSEE